nr:PAS domain S-box protein [uncultured Desulfobulbus sp.]
MEHPCQPLPELPLIRLLIELESGRILEASTDAAIFYGWPLAELRQMHIHDINTLPPKQVRAAMDKAASAECNRFEFVHRTADGSKKMVEVFSSKIMFAGKEVLSSIVHDITERSQIESALRRNEARFRELLENTQEAVYKRNLQKNFFEYISPAFSRFSGYSQDVIRGWSEEDIHDLIHPDDQERVQTIKLAPTASSTDFIQHIEYRFRHACGHYIHLMDRFTLLCDSTGALLSRIGSISDISERKKVEQSIFDAHKRLESIVEATRIGTWEWNVQTGDLVINHQWANMLGYTLAELSPLSASTWRRRIHPDDEQYAVALLEKHILGQSPDFTHEFRLRHKHGHWVWIYSSGRIIRRMSDGEPFIMYGIHIDITDRIRIEESLQQANEHLEQTVETRTLELMQANAALQREMEERRRIERVLRENEERYRRITEGLSDCIYTVHLKDGKAMNITRNAACSRVTGYSADEYAADTELWMRIVIAEDRHLIIENIKIIQETNKPATAEYRILRKDGRVIWVSDTLIPQFNASNELVSYDGVIIDITARKLAEQQLFHSQATLTMAIDGMPDPLILFDSTLQVLRLNKAAKEYYGLNSYEEALGKRCYEAFKGRITPCKTCEHPFFALQGSSGTFERQGAMDPSRLEQVVVDAVKNPQGQPEAYIVRIFDITEARRIDRQLIQREKLASLGLLVAGIAHEINNPNNFIFFNTPILRSYLHFLLPIVDEYAASRPELEVFHRPYQDFREDCFTLLNNIEHGSTRINQIVSNLREFVRERGQGEKRLVDIKHLVEKAITICQGKIKKNVKQFTVDLSEGLPPVHSDPLALEQIVVNLLINAAQAMDKEQPQIHLRLATAEEHRDEIVIAVEDNGCGMDQQTRRRIFDPFFTTKAAGEGTGLGLSICHRLITELGGRIEVRSEIGKGSVFQIFLKISSPNNDSGVL